MVAALSLTAASCSDVAAPEHTVTVGFDFTIASQGWEAGFADYPVGQDSAMELVAERRALPASLETTGEAQYIAGLNTSDDLFMFMKRVVTNLQPGRRYVLSYTLEIATDAPTGCAGIGGAPGESVYMKLGAVPIEPFAEAEAGIWRMNVDKGQQAEGGSAATVIGDIANGDTDCTDPVYRRKTFEGGGISVQPSPDGQVWLLVGTDSGFEGHTGIYYLTLDVELKG